MGRPMRLGERADSGLNSGRFFKSCCPIKGGMEDDGGSARPCGGPRLLQARFVPNLFCFLLAF